MSLINVKIDLNLPPHSAALILHLRYNANVATKYRMLKTA